MQAQPCTHACMHAKKNQPYYPKLKCTSANELEEVGWRERNAFIDVQPSRGNGWSGHMVEVTCLIIPRVQKKKKTAGALERINAAAGRLTSAVHHQYALSVRSPCCRVKPNNGADRFFFFFSLNGRRASESVELFTHGLTLHKCETNE